MKKLILLAAAVTFAFAANAKVWRINYDENANADFRTITAACNSAKVANTDTLYCEPGRHQASGDDNKVTRDGMKVFGPGWGFEPNYGGTSTLAAAEFSSAIKIAANNVKVSGVVASIDFYAVSHKTLKNITIERCKCYHIESNAVNGDSLKNIRIERCNITHKLELQAAAKKDIYICNNIVRIGSSYCFNIEGNTGNINILRNTILIDNDYGRVVVKNALVQDNIMIHTYNANNKPFDFSQTGNVIRKNVFSLSGGATENAEIVANYPDNYYAGATAAGTFTCKTGSIYRTEEYYMLKDGSPAKNAAYDGGDCGAFGGSTPFIICGRPQGIPYITDVEVPAQPKDNKLTVTFKVANQNE